MSMRALKEHHLADCPRGGGTRASRLQKQGTRAKKRREQGSTSQFLKGTREQGPPWETLQICVPGNLQLLAHFISKCHISTLKLLKYVFDRASSKTRCL